MSVEWQDALAFSGLVAAGINGGAFFAFSTFVMPGLAKLPASEGVSAMQAINVAAPNAAFMTTLFGAGLIGVPVAVSALGNLAEPSARYQLAAVGLSLATIVITAAFHVPRNNSLAALEPSAVTTAANWDHYLHTWTRGNHVRALTSIASAGCYALALRH